MAREIEKRKERVQEQEPEDKPVRYFVERKQTSTNTLEPGKVYRTRGGHKVEVYSVKTKEKEIHGSIFHKGVWEIDTWNLDGSYTSGKANERDIFVASSLSLEVGRRYRSREGQEIKIDYINPDSEAFPVIGAIKDGNNWIPRVWNLKGWVKVPFGPNNDIIAEWSET